MHHNNSAYRLLIVCDSDKRYYVFFPFHAIHAKLRDRIVCYVQFETDVLINAAGDGYIAAISNVVPLVLSS